VIRGFVAGALGFALCGVQFLPPEHAHAASAGHAAVVHRHAALHGQHAHPIGVAFTDDDDSAAVWIDDSFVVAVRPTVPVDLILDWRHPNVGPSSSPLAPGFVEFLARRAHDPPRSPKSPRAPPVTFSI
jgi:hypothetical protein